MDARPSLTYWERQNGHHFTDILKCIFLNENVWISLKISIKFVPRGPINNIPALVQIMAWHRWGDKPLSEPMVLNLLAHLSVTLPRWITGKGSTHSHEIWSLWNHQELSICSFFGCNQLVALYFYESTKSSLSRFPWLQSIAGCVCSWS